MKVLQPLYHLFIRFRYPVSLPEDVASDLGLSLTNRLKFQEFMHCLIDPRYRPSKLTRFMPREQAEAIFLLARRKEKFKQNSLFSYYFKGGWMEFNLQFDEQARLRRLYIFHRDLKKKHEISISS